MSVPEYIRDARSQHREYSRKTKVFKNWLHAAAWQCGWTMDKDESARTANIRAQINLVARSDIRMPPYVRQCLVEAIAMRRSALQIFGEVKFIVGDSVEAHEYFISILETAKKDLSKRDQTNSSAIATPAVSVPTVAVPAVAVPTVAVPRVAVPAVAIPRVAIPRVAVPRVAVPAVAVPTVATTAVATTAVATPAVATAAVAVPVVAVPETQETGRVDDPHDDSNDEWTVVVNRKCRTRR
ncbi:hypothetical protein F4805DRAFT_475013 [Annulohypoxylon moriforme]|nr:hypothetical protein F4805DRAFT_475013 [Annulohypoxylon moriforme]